MKDFWEPQIKRAKLMCNLLSPKSEFKTLLDLVQQE